MNKCEFCNYSKPTKKGGWKCGHTIFSPCFKESACQEALRRMRKEMKVDKIED